MRPFAGPLPRPTSAARMIYRIELPPKRDSLSYTDWLIWPVPQRPDLVSYLTLVEVVTTATAVHYDSRLTVSGPWGAEWVTAYIRGNGFDPQRMTMVFPYGLVPIWPGGFLTLAIDLRGELEGHELVAQAEVIHGHP